MSTMSYTKTFKKKPSTQYRFRQIMGPSYYQLNLPINTNKSTNMLSQSALNSACTTFLRPNPDMIQRQTYRKLDHIIKNGSMADLHKFYSKHPNWNPRNYYSAYATELINSLDDIPVTENTKSNVKHIFRKRLHSIHSRSPYKYDYSHLRQRPKSLEKSFDDINDCYDAYNTLMNSFEGQSNVYSNRTIDRINSYSKALKDDLINNEIYLNSKPVKYSYYDKHKDKREMKNFISLSPTNNKSVICYTKEGIEDYFSFNPKRRDYNLRKIIPGNKIKNKDILTPVEWNDLRKEVDLVSKNKLYI